MEEIPTPSSSIPPEEPQNQETPPVSLPLPSTTEHKHRKRTIFYIAATVIALVILAMASYQPIITAIKYVFSILSPLIIGAVIAYLCNPILEFFEYRLLRRMPKGNTRRGLSLLLTVLAVFGILAVVGVMMIPQLVESISELFKNYEVYLNSLLSWINSTLNKLTENLHVEIVDISDVNKFMAFLEEAFGSAENAVSELIAKFQQIASDGNLLEKTWAMMLELFNTFKNLLLGVFIAFYIMGSKEKRVAQFAKFRRAMFKEKTDKKIEEFITLADKSFGGFIYGKLLDSLVIGILMYILLWIFDVSPYNMLIATIVGITNVIPVFGPFIGAIPCFFVVLISNPEKAFLFLVLVLIVQELDGNVIGPKILGDNTGISSLAVLVSIAVCSAMWGIIGMLIGVPVFAVVIEMVKRFLESRLAAKGEPIGTEHYYPADAVGNAEMDVHYEHSSLRYRYEHSNLKPRVDKLRRAFLSHLGRQSKRKTPPTNTGSSSSGTSGTDSKS